MSIIHRGQWEDKAERVKLDSLASLVRTNEFWFREIPLILRYFQKITFPLTLF